MAGRERRPRRSGANGRGMPPPWLSGWFDPELKALFEDEPELYETAHLLRSSRPHAEPTDVYRRRLRDALMTEAEGTVGRQSRLRRWFMPGPRHLAWGGAAAGVALVAATALAVFSTRVQDHQTVVAFSDVAAQHAVSPEQVVTVAFNQAMDHAAVVAGLSIQPATEVTTTWHGNDLVIAPVHHFAGNTPYTVTIAQPNLRTAIGTVAAAPVLITFGTAPTPPPGAGPASPPSLNATQLGQASASSGLLFAPDGSVVATAGLPSASSATPSAPSSPIGGTSPPASGSASPSATGTLAGGPALVEFSGGNSAVLGQQASAAAFAPDGATLAAALPGQGGSTVIVVEGAGGGNPSVIATSTKPVVALAWAGATRIAFATQDAVRFVELAGAAGRTVTPPAGTGAVTRLSPDGRFAYLAPASGTGGTLLDLGDGSTRVLGGSTIDVAFSADGSSVAWVDRSSSTSRLLTSPMDRDAPAPVSTLDPGARLTLLAISRDASAVAYTIDGTSGAEQLVVAGLPTGSALALGPAARSATFSPQGTAIAFMSGSTVELGQIPGAVAAPVSTMPAAAITTLDAFVAAQVSGDAGRMQALSGSGLDAAGQTPHGLSRAYVLDSSSADPSTVKATVDLIVDPTAKHVTPQYAAETLTLVSAGADKPYLVTDLSVPPLRDLPRGPHVVHVGSGSSRSHYVLQVTFDSDLDPATVADAISMLGDNGTRLSGVTTYDANSRTATVTLDSVPAGPVTVTIATTLRDVSGQALATQFRSITGG